MKRLVGRLGPVRRLFERLNASDSAIQQLQATVETGAIALEACRADLRALEARLAQTQSSLEVMKAADAALREEAAARRQDEFDRLIGIRKASGLAWARRGPMLLKLHNAPPFLARNARLSPHLEALAGGAITMLAIKEFGIAGPPLRNDLSSVIFGALLRGPDLAAGADRFIPPDDALRDECDDVQAHDNYLMTGAWLSADPDLVDFVAAAYACLPALAQKAISVAPFDKPGRLPALVPAEAKRRSALFVHNSYYHFNHLADGLRARGWDAMTVSVEDPMSAQRQFFHGEDLNLFDANFSVMREKVRDFARIIPERFGALHFYGMGQASLFPELFENTDRPIRPAFDFHEFRRHGIIIGFMPSGCLDGATQSAIREASGVCRKCVWEHQPDVCSDARNAAWADRLAQVCDWIGLEGDWYVGARRSPKHVRGPVATTLDQAIWHPDIEVPDELRIDRQPGELLVYHAVGNYETRRAGGRDIKGTGAVMAAIDRLKAEGLPVKLFFAHDIPSQTVRYVQVQADVVVDQLNYGRYGANAREAMMLGRPLIVRLNPADPDASPARAASEVPALDATEETVAEVLREILLDPERRKLLGQRARAFAIAWHGKDACAERFEKVIDRLRAGMPPDSDDLYPAERF